MLYGIYNSQTDSNQVYSVFQGKKIQKDALCPLHNIEMLLSRIQTGDTVWCVSIKSFGSDVCKSCNGVIPSGCRTSLCTGAIFGCRKGKMLETADRAVT